MAKGGYRGGMPMGGMNQMQMMKQAQKMQENLMKMQEELQAKEYEATAGGGVITAVCGGNRELKSITIDPEAGASPEISDITDYKVPVEFVEVDANLVYSVIQDVDLAVINGNYALDSGLTADDAIFKESEYADNSYYCLIAVRTEDAENPVYKRIVEAYQTQDTIDIYNDEFKGFFVPAWTLG